MEASLARRGIALLLCPLLCLQACTTASPLPLGAVLSRSVVERTIELKADPDTAGHLPSAEEYRSTPHPPDVTRLREAQVIPVSLIIRNVGTDDVIVETAASSLEMADGRIFPVIPLHGVVLRLPSPIEPPSGSAPAAPETPPSEPPTTEMETPKGIGREIGEGALRAVLIPLLLYFGLPLLIGTSPIWGPALLISLHNKRKFEEQRNRSLALERLEEVRLAKGEAAGGVLYFAAEGELPATLATATLVVIVRQAATGEDQRVRLLLGSAD